MSLGTWQSYLPPLLAYQIASSFPKPGQFVDLFSGAGGLALGFIWAGWTPIVANDIEQSYLETYATNIDKHTVLGDIRNTAVFNRIIEVCEARRNRKVPLLVLGGPPCQGFSTAGKRRSMDDDRNWLFKQYKKVLHKINPTAFVFENVTGLLNMDGGKVFEMVRSELLKETESLSVWKLKAEEYGIPQRRTRVILVGSKNPLPIPTPITQFAAKSKIVIPSLPSVTQAYFHAALMLSMCALEAHLNAIGEEFATHATMTVHDKSLLIEKEVRLENGVFELKTTPKMTRIDERIEFMYVRLSGKSLDKTASWWSRLSNAIKLRNSLTHAKTIPAIDETAVKSAIESIIEGIDTLYRAIYKKPFPAAGKGLHSTLTF